MARDDKQTSQTAPPTNTSSELSFWQKYEATLLLTTVGGAVDTIGFIGLFGFFTNHVTGNLVMAGAGLVKDDAGLWIKLGALPVFLLTVIVVKRIIDINQHNKLILSHLLFAEVFFLMAFFVCAVYFSPFQKAGTLDIAITGFFGLIAFAIRNTASKTVMGKTPSSLLMTGNTTQLGINLSDYFFNRTQCNMVSLKHSLTVVLSFTFGALLGTLLYIWIEFWSIAPFIIPVLYLAFAVRNHDYRDRHNLKPSK